MMNKSSMLNKHPLVVGFLMGFISRLLAEIIFGKYPLGYDTSTFYIYMLACTWWKYIFSAPLYSLILLGLYHIIGNAILTVKLAAPFVCGFYTFSLTFWGLKDKSIDKKFLFSFVIFVATFWISIKINFDLHRNLFAISFALLAISIRKESPKLASLLSLLSIVSHPFGILLLSGVYLYDLMQRDYRAVLPIITSSVAIIILVGIMVYVFNYDLISIITGPVWYIDRAVLPLYFLWIYLPIWILLISFYLRDHNIVEYILKQKDMLIWALTLFIFSVILKFGYRILWMMFLPLTIMSFRYASNIRINRRRIIRLLLIYNMIMMIIFPVIHYSYPLMPSFRETKASKPVFGTFFPWEAPHAEKLFREALKFINSRATNDIVLIVRHMEISYAYAAGVPLCNKKLVYVMDEDQNFLDAFRVLASRFKSALFVWYINPPPPAEKVPENARIIKTDGALALYLYYF